MRPSVTRSIGFLFAAALLCMGTRAFAQGVTTAAINGTVRDESGQTLPGANIIAVHVPSGTSYGTSSRENGKYDLSNLRVGGPWRVTFSYVGYEKQTREVAHLALGENFRLDVTMSTGAVELGAVEVTGDRSGIFSAARTGAAQSVSTAQIERFPTISRSFQDFSKFSPQVSGNSIAGRNGRYNNIQIDGTQYNDLFGLGSSGTPGGQANTNPISLDALQEFQVVVAPYDVRQGRFSGGGINAITRSGTNKVEGSAYYFMRSEGMIGDLNTTRWLTNGTPGSFRDTLIKTPFANFSEYQAGFRVGGPIIENQLFFFVNAEQTGRTQPYANLALTQGTDPNLVRTTAETMQSILINKYGYDPGSFSGYDAERPSTKLFARVDWNLAGNHKLTLRHNFVDAYDDIYRPSATSFLFGNRNYRFHNNVNSTVLQLSSTFAANMSNELIVGYTRIRDYREFFGKPFPTVNLTVAGVTLNAGAENFSIANKLDQDVFEITNNFTYYMGDHVFTVGTQNEFFSFGNLFIRDYYGTYSFNSVADLERGVASRLQYSFARPGIDPMFMATFGAAQLGLYAQDEWSVTKNFKTTIGLRLDMPMINDNPAYNITADTARYNASTAKAQANPGATYGLRTDKVPATQYMISPRVGFNWDVFGDRSTQVRGGAGLFTGRVPFVWISNQFSNTGVEFARLDLRTRTNDTVRFDPNLDPRDPAFLSRAGTATEINITADDFMMPQTARFNLAVDQKLPWGLVGTLEGIYTKTLNDIYYRDINLGDRMATTSFGNVLPGGRGVYGTFSGRTTTPGTQVGTFSRGPFTNVILLENTSEGYAWNVSGQLQKQFENGFMAAVAYTYSEAKDQNSGLSSQAVSNWRFNHTPDSPNELPLTRSLFDIPHRMITSASYRFEYATHWATTVSIFYEGRSGSPFSYVYDGDLNADGQVENDLIYVPNDRNDIALVRVNGSNTTRAPETDYDALDSYISRDEYLSTVRGKIAERYGAREPWWGRFDLRIAQEIPNPLVMSNKLEITLDILNVLNFFNGEWNRIQSVPNNRDLLIRFEGLAAAQNTLGPNGVALPAGTPLFSYKDKKDPFQYDDLASRWQMQVGIRYTF
jgi:hypothetical protein